MEFSKSYFVFLMLQAIFAKKKEQEQKEKDDHSRKLKESK